VARSGIYRHLDGALRDLVLCVESVPDADPDEVDRSVRLLRTELRELEVESVALVTAEDTPPDAKGADPLNLESQSASATSSECGGHATVSWSIVWLWLAMACPSGLDAFESLRSLFNTAPFNVHLGGPSMAAGSGACYWPAGPENRERSGSSPGRPVGNSCRQVGFHRTLQTLALFDVRLDVDVKTWVVHLIC
jgi:hypothetical protein